MHLATTAPSATHGEKDEEEREAGEEEGTKLGARAAKGFDTKVHSAISPSPSISLVVVVVVVVVAVALCSVDFDSPFSHASKPSPLVAPDKE